MYTAPGLSACNSVASVLLSLPNLIKSFQMWGVKQLALLNHVINICLKHTFRNKTVWERTILSNRSLLHMRYKRIIHVYNHMTVE